MGHEGLNIERLLLEIRAGDEPVLVAADVEDERAGSSRVIGGREGLLDLREMLPTGGPRKGQESGQWLACGGMLLCVLFRRRFAQNRHIQMFPYLGTGVKGKCPRVKFRTGGRYLIMLPIRSPIDIRMIRSEE